MELLELKTFINENLAITLLQNDYLIEITPEMVDLLCNDLQELKKEIAEIKGGENGK